MSVSPIFLGHYSLGAVPPAERFAAAAKAGFDGIGVAWSEISAAQEAGGLEAFKAQVDGRGLAAPQLEIIRLVPRAELRAFAEQAPRIASAAAVMGCEVVHAVAQGEDLDYADFAESFGLLTRACADRGMACGIEFVPYVSAIPDLESALRLVRTVGLPNGGVVVDSLHFFRGGAQWAALESLGESEVTSIQINDAPLQRPTDDYYAEAMGGRLLPGEGELDLTRFLGVLAGVAPAVPITVEVVSKALDALGAEAAATAMASSTRALLAGLRPIAQVS